MVEYLPSHVRSPITGGKNGGREVGRENIEGGENEERGERGRDRRQGKKGRERAEMEGGREEEEI